MNEKFVDFMYYFPIILLIIAAVIYSIYVAGFEILIFYLIVLIAFIFLHFWSEYWLKKKYEVKHDRRY